MNRVVKLGGTNSQATSGGSPSISTPPISGGVSPGGVTIKVWKNVDAGKHMCARSVVLPKE